MARLTHLTSLLCLSILLPLGLAGQTQQPPPQIDPAFRSQTQDSVLPPETRAQINKLASRVAEQLHKSETNPAGRKLLVMDFPIADSTQVSELGVLLANEFSESLSSYAGSFVVADRTQVATILKEEEITRESLLNKEMSLYVAKKAGADETLTGFLVKGSDGNLILSVRAFGRKRKKTLDATLTTTDPMRELLAKEVQSPEPEAEAIEPEPGILAASKDGVSNPSCVYCPTPQYSDLARMAKYSGTIKLSVIVTVEGHATAIKVIQGAPFGLTKQAILEVQEWRFKAAEKDGKPVAVRVPVEVTFRLLSETASQTPFALARPGQGGVTYPQCTSCPGPQYPEEAKRAKIRSAKVVLQAVITPEGRAIDIRVIQGPEHGFIEEAIRAVRTWRFKPATGPDGKPVPTICPIEITFRLK